MKGTMDKKVIIVGAGASGLVAAIMAAKKGFDVLVFESNEKPAKKIYATGNGKCNLTNSLMDKTCYRSDDIKKVEDVLSVFGFNETKKFFDDLGIILKDRNGYFYPNSNQAASVAEALVYECERLNIKIVCSSEVREVLVMKDKSFSLKVFSKLVGSQATYICDKLILACGSNSGVSNKNINKITGYDMAKSLGHEIVPVVSALTALRCKNKKFYNMASGVRCDVLAEVFVDNKLLGSDAGELQLTDYGVSGIPVFQISRFASYGIYYNNDVRIHIDFMPTHTVEELSAYINKILLNNSLVSVSKCLLGMLNSKLVDAILSELKIKKDTLLKNEDIDNIIYKIKNFEDVVIATNDIQNSQVSAGGVKLSQMDHNMQSKLVENLYITGELLNVDGICGGYNLQWAWATGYIAGKDL